MIDFFSFIRHERWPIRAAGEVLMRFILILVALLTMGCKDLKVKDKDKGDDDFFPDTYVVGAYEYVNEDGLCAIGEWFGDSPNGCLKVATLYIFMDGSAFLTMSLGPNVTTTWNWTVFLPPGTNSFNRTLPLGSGISFKVLGTLSTPKVEITYDTNGNYSDTQALNIAFQAINF